MDNFSEELFVLKPVTFHYKNQIDPKQRLDYGLIAEDVAEVNPELAIRNQKGEIESVNYGAIYAMLLNEFLKEHRAFVEEQRKVADQQKEIDGLKTELKEQRSLIQKVSDRMELKGSTTQVAISK